MASSATSSDLDPLLQAYYAQQQRNINDTYQIGLAQNQEQKDLSDLSYQQKLSALQDQLGQQQGTFSDAYAGKGLMHSGIYNWNGAGQLGAKQQFFYDKALAQSNLTNQQNMLDQQYAQKGVQLGTAYGDNTSTLNSQSLLDQTRQGINDAISGA